MDTFRIHNARKMRTNFSLVYISLCRFKCPIKITRQSSNSCDAGSHRCADETTARLNCPATRWRTPCRSVGRVRQLRYTTSATPPRRPPMPPPAPRDLPFATLLKRKPTFRYIIVLSAALSAKTGIVRYTQVDRALPTANCFSQARRDAEIQHIERVVWPQKVGQLAAYKRCDRCDVNCKLLVREKTIDDCYTCGAHPG